MGTKDLNISLLNTGKTTGYNDNEKREAMKKFRGQRRYYRKLATGLPETKKQIAEWIDGLAKGSLQRDYDHIHYGCPKSSLFRWKAVKPHLDALIRDFETVAQAAKSVNTQFQLWAFVGMDRTFGADPILYIHTPNHEHNDFPQKFNNFTKTFQLKNNALSQYLEKLSQKGYSILYSQTEPQFTQIVIYSDDVGVNLYTPEDGNVGAVNDYCHITDDNGGQDVYSNQLYFRP